MDNQQDQKQQQIPEVKTEMEQEQLKESNLEQQPQIKMEEQKDNQLKKEEEEDDEDSSEEQIQEEADKKVVADQPKQENDIENKKQKKSTNKNKDKDKKKKIKKKIGKKKNKFEVIDENETDYEQDWQERMKNSKILEDPNLPEEVKKQYAYYENQPCIMIISNVPSSVTTTELEEYFNTLIIQLNPRIPQDRVIKKIEYGPSKTWVALECISLEAKKTLVPLNYVEFVNCKLRVEKPRKFLKRIMNATPESIAQNNDVQKYEECRLYMGGLPAYLFDDDVKKLIHTFGATKYFNLVKDNEGISKGYCFFEYERPSSTVKALRALNGLQIADRRLKVCKVDNQPVVQKTSGDEKQPSNYAGSFLASCELLKIPEVQQMLTIPQSAIIPSKVVQFLNMVSSEDLFEDDIFEEVLEDIRTECSQFGNIERIEIPRPDRETGFSCPAVGKIFVKFYYQIPAKICKHHMAGRTYNKRTVITSFYPEEKFDLKDYLITG